jgi:UDP-N-acetylmuramoylalanine--D-glutamate ligase
LKSSLDQLKDFENITYKLGLHEHIDFVDKDFILEAAGVPFNSEYILHARKYAIPIYMSAALTVSIVYKHLPGVQVIGVTGTRGKSTTTKLIAHILEQSGKTVHLGGNMRGIANLPILKEIKDGDYLILELDSWQLQGFEYQKISPHIAVFTSFMADHMNYYHGDQEAYYKDKANIYKYQKAGDVLIASPQVQVEIAKRDKDQSVIVPKEQHFQMDLIGQHNQISAQLAHEVATRCGVDEKTIRESIKNFKAVNGRLEDMGIFKGVRVFNDNNATTPEAVIVALDAINETYNKKPILITGGGDKNVPLEKLEDAIKNQTKEYVLLDGAGTQKLHLEKKYIYERLDDCVSKAFDLAQEGDIILFSPAFVSFSKYFNNEYERNDTFVRLVSGYK